MKIALLSIGNAHCVACAAEFPDRERCIVRCCASQREDDFFRTKSHTRIFTALFNGEYCDRAICAHAGAGVERHAQCAVIPQDLTARRTRLRARFSRKTGLSRHHAARHLRPDKMRRERPPSERAGGRLRGLAAGSSRPRTPPSAIRANSEAAKTGALIVGTGCLELFVLQQVVTARCQWGLFGARRGISASCAAERGNTAPVSVFPLFDTRLSRIVVADLQFLLGAQEVRAQLARDGDP